MRDGWGCTILLLAFALSMFAVALISVAVINLVYS
jgi:hypothetical protein